MAGAVSIGVCFVRLLSLLAPSYPCRECLGQRDARSLQLFVTDEVVAVTVIFFVIILAAISCKCVRLRTRSPSLPFVGTNISHTLSVGLERRRLLL